MNSFITLMKSLNIFTAILGRMVLCIFEEVHKKVLARYNFKESLDFYHLFHHRQLQKNQVL